MKKKMTREDLLKALLVERFGPRPRDTRTVVYVVEEPIHDDTLRTIKRRRKELEEADLEADRRVKDKPA